MIKTCVVEITDLRLRRSDLKIFTSAEGDNPGGSIKDHMVFNELNELLRSGKLRKGDWVSEVSSGSTALSLAYYSKHFELNCHLFVPENLPAEKKRQLEILGAHVHALKVEGIYEVHADFLKKHPHCYFFNQLFDETKTRHYKSLGESFLQKSESYFDFVIGAVGTGHSLKGVATAHTGAVLCSAEPKPNEPCSGVRNIQNERYGEKDPCVVKNFQRRIVVDVKNFFPDSLISTDHGQLKICESFRLVLGAILTLPVSDAPRAVLALGAQNYFSIAK